MAILSNHNGNLSSIHHYIANHNIRILSSINYSLSVPIARSQLPNVLENRCLKAYYSPILAYCYQKQNISGLFLIRTADAGKDLKGSIETRNITAGAIVQAVTHKNKVIQRQGYYGRYK